MPLVSPLIGEEQRMVDAIISAAFVATSALWFLIGWYARSTRDAGTKA